MKQKKIFAVVLIIINTMINYNYVFAQSSAGETADIEMRNLVDVPTAGLLKRGAFAFDLDFFQQGGMTFSLSAGALDRLNFGISFGGAGFIGYEKVVPQKNPGVMLKFRLFDETQGMPAIAFGFNSQGKETYLDSLERFTIKSPGVYIAASKNYSMMGNLSWHGGVNLSMERKDGDKDLNIFAGIEKSIGKDISLVFDYDFAFNDNLEKVGKGRGYLNGGVLWSFGNGFLMAFNLKNIVKNNSTKEVTIGNRTLHIEYIRTF
ncbi:MAG: YjbH domain-containing protein [Bacteroidetes bacterium]|nr:YjbH domain-containing protein [Bacteroidota bacterium]